ncbi:MAG TPA: DUF2971 domain-containing protein, partial [Flavobacteriales bacterium]|nr:DUF2971 domain-containing protein [Flavobacteriales bacterium]
RGFYPVEGSTVIWRYLDFTKYVHLLNSQHLYFNRLDLFEDPLEGTYPVKNEASIPFFKQLEETRKFSYVNCWHMNDGESAGMWSLYARHADGVAIQSTFDRLKTSIEAAPESILISKVKYHDYAAKSVDELSDENRWSENSPGSTVSPQIFKRKSFEHEKELRAVYVDLPIEFEPEKIKQRNLPPGRLVSVNLDALVERIHVDPKSSGWFYDLVRAVTSRYGLTKDVIKSDLYDR